MNEIAQKNKEIYANESITYDDGCMQGLVSIDVEKERVRQWFMTCRMCMNRTSLTILEIGAGTGLGRRIVGDLLEDGLYYSTEISLSMLKQARNKQPTGMYAACEAEILPFCDCKFDMVVCASMLHHLSSDETICKEVSRVLKANGYFIGMREPRMDGCDFWMRSRHIILKYGDRKGLIQLLRSIIFSKGKTKIDVLSYNMNDADFQSLDLQEIRGAILHPTPTKRRGGINSTSLKGTLNGHFHAYFFTYRFAENIVLFLFTLLLRKRMPNSILMLAYRCDRILSGVSTGFPFESFGFICRKVD